MCAQPTVHACPQTMDVPERSLCRNCVLLVVEGWWWWLAPVIAKRLPVDPA